MADGDVEVPDLDACEDPTDSKKRRGDLLPRGVERYPTRRRCLQLEELMLCNLKEESASTRYPTQGRGNVRFTQSALGVICPAPVLVIIHRCTPLPPNHMHLGHPTCMHRHLEDPCIARPSDSWMQQGEMKCRNPTARPRYRAGAGQI